MPAHQTVFEGFKRVQAEPLPRYTNALALAASTAESVTVPSWAGVVRVAATAAVYLKEGGTATVPTDTTDGSASFLVPANAAPQWFVIRGSQTLSVISSSTAVVTFSFFED